MKNKLYLGRGIYLSLLFSKKKQSYKVVLEFYDDITEHIASRKIDYFDTYVDALYFYYYLRDKYFCLF